MREDSLAAQLMGMPVPWLKLMAFSFGAAIAALTGTLVRRVERLRVPGQLRSHAADHDLRDDDPRRHRQPGRGGARRHPDQRFARVAARAVELPLHLLCRARARSGRGVQALGPPRRGRGRASSFSASSSGSSSIGLDSSWTGAAPEGGGWLGDLIARWVVEPPSVTPWVKSVTYISLIALALLLTTLDGWARLGVAGADALPRGVRLGERARSRTRR